MCKCTNLFCDNVHDFRFTIIQRHLNAKAPINEIVPFKLKSIISRLPQEMNESHITSITETDDRSILTRRLKVIGGHVK